MSRTVQFALALQFASVYLAAQPIGILFDFNARPDKVTLASMQSEIREILGPAQLELSFQPVTERSTRTFRKIVIVRFRGVCQGKTHRVGLELNEATPGDFPALGRTIVSAGRVLPFVQVFCDEVREFVPFSTGPSAARIFGRALGRVVAHELYHALLATRDHSSTGVARFAQSPFDLTREKLALDHHSIDRLRELYPQKEKEDDSEESSSSAEAYHH
jgi:hypothetical protein